MFLSFWQKLKILTTGLSGFTGRHFKQVAEASGYTVVPLSADINDKFAVINEVASVKPEAVLHLAAISFVGHVDDAAFYDVNVIGTTNLLAALALSPTKPHRVLLASSANVYGNCETSPVSELQPPAPVNHYAMSKLAMEHMALTYADRLPLVITRPFNYTGPGQASQFLIPKLVHHFKTKAPKVELGNLHVEREFNDVRMVCDSYLRLLKNGEPSQVYNVCTGKPYTLQHVIDLLVRITGNHLQVEVNPAFVRANEVHRLCGNPAKLEACIGPIESPTLEDTLAWMLAS